MGLVYCFQQNLIEKTLKKMKAYDLAVIDSNGIDKSVIQAAKKRGVFIYDYLNAGALERQRDYYKDFKDLRLAEYDGWVGQYWVDVTNQAWQDHLVNEAKKKKEKGADGLYFDNTDIYYMCKHGFREQKTKMMQSIPKSLDVYFALRDVIIRIVKQTGLIVMPNGGDAFVKMFFAGVIKPTRYIKTVNQQGVLYEDNKKQPRDQTQYRTDYLNWCKKQGLYIRGIQYTKSSTAALKCKLYYKKQGWQGLYISKHKDLKGD